MSEFLNSVTNRITDLINWNDQVTSILINNNLFLLCLGILIFMIITFFLIENIGIKKRY